MTVKASELWLAGDAVWSHQLLPTELLTIAGQDGDDAKQYQERDVRDALKKLNEAQRRQHR